MDIGIYIYDRANIVPHIFVFQVYVLYPKQDLHGLGFDPFKHAPEFRGMQFIRWVMYF